MGLSAWGTTGAGMASIVSRVLFLSHYDRQASPGQDDAGAAELTAIGTDLK